MSSFYNYFFRSFVSRFAELTATIFLHAGYPVNMFNKFVPTPFVPFTVTKLKCAAGVMVTASHNPKEDNGYKVGKQELIIKITRLLYCISNWFVFLHSLFL